MGRLFMKKIIAALYKHRTAQVVFLLVTLKQHKILKHFEVFALIKLEHNIKAILTAAKGIGLNHPKSEIPYYLQVPGEDREGFDMARFFTQGVNFIKDSL